VHFGKNKRIKTHDMRRFALGAKPVQRSLTLLFRLMRSRGIYELKIKSPDPGNMRQQSAVHAAGNRNQAGLQALQEPVQGSKTLVKSRGENHFETYLLSACYRLVGNPAFWPV